MTGFDYTKTRDAAERLIARFGQAGRLRRISHTGPDYDPVQTAEDFFCRLVDLDYAQAHIDDTLIQRGDRMICLSTEGLDITPGLSDRLLIDGAGHAIIDVQPLSPGGIVVFWQMQVRR